jgi:hypothetical protein
VVDTGTGRSEFRPRYSGTPSDIRTKLQVAWDFTGSSTRLDKIGELLGSASPINLTPFDANPAEINGLTGKAAEFVKANNQALAPSTAFNSDPRILVPTNNHWFMYVIGKLRAGSLPAASSGVIACKYTGAGNFEYNFHLSSAFSRIVFAMNGPFVTDPWVPVADVYFLGMVRYVHDAAVAANRMIGIKILPVNGTGPDTKAWTQTNLSAGPLQSTGRLAFGRRGASALDFGDIVIDEAGIGHGELTAQNELDLWNNGGLLGWPLEVGLGRIYAGEAVADATALGAKTHSIPVYRTDGTILCWVEGKLRP